MSENRAAGSKCIQRNWSHLRISLVCLLESVCVWECRWYLLYHKGIKSVCVSMYREVCLSVWVQLSYLLYSQTCVSRLNFGGKSVLCDWAANWIMVLMFSVVAECIAVFKGVGTATAEPTAAAAVPFFVGLPFTGDAAALMLLRPLQQPLEFASSLSSP